MFDILRIPRVLDLSVGDDEEVFRQASAASPEFADLVAGELSDYLELFPEKHWRTVRGGFLALKAGRQSTSVTIGDMLRTTRSLKKLKKYNGFEKLIAGFRNLTQVLATCFEVTIAEWCAERAVTISLEFSPEVPVKGRIKRPEFRWETSLGRLYAECKRGEVCDNDYVKRFERFQEIVSDEYNLFKPWDPALRLDLAIEGVARNGIELRLRETIRSIAMAQHGGAFGRHIEFEEVHATLRNGDEPTPVAPCSV